MHLFTLIDWKGFGKSSCSSQNKLKKSKSYYEVSVLKGSVNHSCTQIPLKSDKQTIKLWYSLTETKNSNIVKMQMAILLLLKYLKTDINGVYDLLHILTRKGI